MAININGYIQDDPHQFHPPTYGGVLKCSRPKIIQVIGCTEGEQSGDLTGKCETHEVEQQQ